MTGPGTIGVWSAALRFGDPAQARDLAAELEDLGYQALWLPGGDQPGVLDAAANLLTSTRSITVATGILNIWFEDPATIGELVAELDGEHGPRLLLGIGASHGPVVGDRYRRPLTAVAEYLDALDTGPRPVSPDRRIVAALGPKMLDLAARRSAGSHPYLVTPEFTRWARERLGDGPILAPEQTVVLDPDPVSARATARQFLATYLQLPNYTDNLARSGGFTPEDFTDGGSDRLVDAVFAWGTEDLIRARIDAHLDAGADHVCVQVAAGWTEFTPEPLRRLAPALDLKNRGPADD